MSVPPAVPLLEVRDVTKSFGNVAAVQGVSFPALRRRGARPRRERTVQVVYHREDARRRGLSCLFSRTSLALASLREGLRGFDGGRLIVGILYLFWISDFGFWTEDITSLEIDLFRVPCFGIYPYLQFL